MQDDYNFYFMQDGKTVSAFILEKTGINKTK